MTNDLYNPNGGSRMLLGKTKMLMVGTLVTSIALLLSGSANGQLGNNPCGKGTLQTAPYAYCNNHKTCSPWMGASKCITPKNGQCTCALANGVQSSTTILWGSYGSCAFQNVGPLTYIFSSAPGCTYCTGAQWKCGESDCYDKPTPMMPGATCNNSGQRCTSIQMAPIGSCF